MKLAIEINAPADAVWELVGTRFGELSTWANPVHASRMLEADLRQCQTSLGTVHERVLAFDDAARTLTYEAVVRPPWMKRGVNRWTVTPLGAHRCRVESVATIEVHGREMLRLVGLLPRLVRMSRTLDDLRVYAETGEPSARKRRAGREVAEGGGDGIHPAAWGLWANAVLSTVTGGALVVDLAGLAGQLDLPATVTRAAGVGLLGFALLVGWVARRVRTVHVLAISAADLAWVAGSAAWLAYRPDLAPLVGGAAVAVLTVASAQLAGAWVGRRGA